MKRIYFNTKEIITRERKGYIEVEDNYTQIYDNLFNLSLKMKSPTDFSLLLFACKKANKTGMFITDESFYKSYIKESKNNITRQTFTNSIKNLNLAKIFIKISRGSYQLNPILIWKDSVSNRENIIKDLYDDSSLKDYTLLESTETVEEPKITYSLLENK